MDSFLSHSDTLADLINQKALKLFHLLETLPIKELNLPPSPLKYYLERHQNRKFFSVQTAAELLYRSIQYKKLEVKDICIMDYGGGLGSLFLLAKMIGCKTVIYNDIRTDMTEAAKIISNYLKIPIDYFAVGDHHQTLSFLKEKNINCDIILSRNVVEHIYNLKDFYQTLIQNQPQTLVYFSTTANYHNLGSRLYHQKIHRSYEQQYLSKRKELIHVLLPELEERSLNVLAEATRGLAFKDFEDAVKTFKENGKIPDPSIHFTNTTDPESGVWAEHVIPKWEYQDIIRPCGYKLEIIPAFWDTHYNNNFKSIFGKGMNLITKLLGKNAGLWTTAFIYIIAEPNKA